MEAAALNDPERAARSAAVAQRARERMEKNKERHARNETLFGERFKRPLTEMDDDTKFAFMELYKSTGNTYFK